VILKASELCPWTHQLILEIFTEAGLPPGVINQIQADRADAVAVTEALIADPGIKKIEFIGSAGVGKVIAGLGAKYLKPVLMECGDQSPCIILDDADLEQAATLCAQGGKDYTIYKAATPTNDSSPCSFRTALLVYRADSGPK